MSEFGLKIKNIKAGTLFGYNQGVRDRYDYTDAMFSNSLFSDYIRANGSKIADPVIKHIAQKGKKATIANIQTAASILGYKDYKNVSKWSSAQKNALVKKLQSYGFANGGIIRELIPASMGTLLGDAIMKNGDTGFIGAKPGETVLTEEFTNMLKPTVAAMNAFTDMYQKMSTPNINSTATKQQTIFNPEYNINSVVYIFIKKSFDRRMF